MSGITSFTKTTDWYLDCERMRHPNTGIHEFCRRLANALVPQLAADERLFRYGPPSEPGLLNPRIDWLPHRHYHKFLGVRPKNAAVWHSTYQKSRYLPPRSVPLVLTIHDLNFLHEGKDADSVARNIALLQKNVDRAARVVAISNFVASEIRERLTIDPARLSVVYNGCGRIDLAERRAPSVIPERPFVFALGPTIPKKNFHVLPALLRGNDFELVLAGFTEEPYAGRILEAAARLGVRGRVRIVGPVDEVEKAWYYANCSAFAFPSLAEGFGLPVVEAMLFGKRVFLSTSTSLPEIGGTLAGYFDSFDPDAMSALFNTVMSRPLSETGAEALRSRARAFSWEKSAAGYLGLYRELSGRERA